MGMVLLRIVQILLMHWKSRSEGILTCRHCRCFSGLELQIKVKEVQVTKKEICRSQRNVSTALIFLDIDTIMSFNTTVLVCATFQMLISMKALRNFRNAPLENGGNDRQCG